MALDAYVRIAKHAALGDVAALLDALVALGDDPPAIAEALRRHHLVPLVRSLVAEDMLCTRIDARLVDGLASVPAVGRPLALLLSAFDETYAALAAEGVSALLLKGFYFADRLYGGAERRPQHDLDLLVHRPDFRRSRRILQRLGFTPTTRDLHSQDFVRGDVKIDLHRFLRWAPAFALDERAVWDSVVTVRGRGRSFRTLSDEYTLVFLAMASFEDLGQGMGKLKQLLDLYLLLRAVEPTMDWEAFLQRRAHENLLPVTVGVFSLVTDLFDAREELSRLSAALDRHRDPRATNGRAEALALLAAPRKSRANLVWFGRLYPGSLVHYLAWFWYGGFPANTRRLGPGWLLSQLRVASELRRSRAR